MNWPPVKSWTSKYKINGYRHFVAINYGGNLKDRWVVLIAVLDGSLIIKVNWLQLNDRLNWKPGWNDDNFSEVSKPIKSEIELKCTYPSEDSGLTIPITKNKIRSWFNND